MLISHDCLCMYGPRPLNSLFQFKGFGTPVLIASPFRDFLLLLLLKCQPSSSGRWAMRTRALSMRGPDLDLEGCLRSVTSL